MAPGVGVAASRRVLPHPFSAISSISPWFTWHITDTSAAVSEDRSLQGNYRTVTGQLPPGGCCWGLARWLVVGGTGAGLSGSPMRLYMAAAEHCPPKWFLAAFCHRCSPSVCRAGKCRLTGTTGTAGVWLSLSLLPAVSPCSRRQQLGRGKHAPHSPGASCPWQWKKANLLLCQKCAVGLNLFFILLQTNRLPSLLFLPVLCQAGVRDASTVPLMAFPCSLMFLMASSEHLHKCLQFHSAAQVEITLEFISTD